MSPFKPSLFLRSKPALLSMTLLLVAALAGVFYINAAEAASEYPQVIQAEVDQGMLDVVRSFPAASGLTGWVLSQDGQHSIAYTTADGKTLLAGMLISEEGKNLSEEYEAQFIPRPDLTALYGALGQSAYIAEGALKNPEKIIYAFTDANCPYCHLLWKALQPYEKEGLQVRWIPVAILGASSMPKAIEVMKAADKPAAFAKLATGYGKPWTAMAQNDEANHPQIAGQIRKNALLMPQFNLAATPGVLWKDAQGKVQVKTGMPRLSELAGITGLPEQTMTDSSLMKYQ